jgi:hypothetical protein
VPTTDRLDTGAAAVTTTYYCWRCYGEVGRPRGRCFYCGRQIAVPADVDEAARLVWGLMHPLPDRQLTAACLLARRGDSRAAAVLRGFLTDEDPGRAKAARQALALIEGDPRPEVPLRS